MLPLAWTLKARRSWPPLERNLPHIYLYPLGLRCDDPPPPIAVSSAKWENKYSLQNSTDRGAVYITEGTMKSSLALLKYVIGCWTRPGIGSVYIKEEKLWCKTEHGTWGCQRFVFKPTFVHCHGPSGFVVEEANELLLLRMSGDCDREIPF